jgi:hypothetical protein
MLKGERGTRNAIPPARIKSMDRSLGFGAKSERRLMCICIYVYAICIYVYAICFNVGASWFHVCLSQPVCTCLKWGWVAREMPRTKSMNITWGFGATSRRRITWM